MTPTDAPETEQEERGKPPRPKLPRINRTRAMGSQGLAAAAIGWVLVGCIALGFGVGAWLDSRYSTSHWMPIGVLVGVAAGFREMFITLGQVSQKPKPRSQEQGRIAGVSEPRSPSERAVHAQAAAEAEAGRQERRSGLFAVPPPPFLEQGQKQPPAPSADEVRERLVPPSLLQETKGEPMKGEPMKGETETSSKQER
jgi:F0F1-type ATP synthase assembly protein I